MSNNTLTIRPAKAADREAFLEMWRDFVSLAPGEPGNHQMGETNWDRIMDPGHDLKCVVAVGDDGSLAGFTLFLSLAFTWSTGDVCYLQDIYVRPQSRGKGIAQAMIERLRQLGIEAGWFKIFWMTQADNYSAQLVYDKVAKRMDYLRYDLNVGAP
ncbi:GNAT superfamily N-acetyltransferase [Mesorhizobium soli]|uniref:GNAT family N-acetyltransferase n=1 Tax=Pseudaminobacter soli (ex Li et al. 2025) TaxID=1295366 RepID=UPI002472F9AD|nr:GNAT family N-acetyltransferase [Mesorhizobium soli]MDH6235012.1 GNAT superfamily N-acetyltransferase [Mesorhizobium soli]